jgi:hypothetical protein
MESIDEPICLPIKRKPGRPCKDEDGIPLRDKPGYREKAMAYYKNYYNTNKQVLKEKATQEIQCACGKMVSKYYMKKHNATKTCQILSQLKTLTKE